MNLGQHATFIWLSYAAVVFGVGGLIVWLFAEGRRYRIALQELEARGLRRRSSGSDAGPRTTAG